MSPISPGISSFFDYPRFTMENHEFTVSRMSRVETTRKQESDITLITAEGDKVTLSSDSWVEETTVTYHRLLYGKGIYATTRGAHSQFEGDRELTISVEGDLSKEELQDIRKLLKDVDRVIRDFFSGDVEMAPGSALKIGGLDSISTFEASLRYERSTSVEQEVSTQVASSSPETDSVFQPMGTYSLGDLIEKTSSKLAGIIRNAGIDSENALSSIEEYFSKLFSGLSDDDFSHSPKLKAAGWIRSGLLDNLKPSRETEERGNSGKLTKK